MRLRHVTALIITVVVLAGFPFSAYASGYVDKAGVNGSNVSAIVLSDYEFSVPEDAVVTYPSTYKHLGKFVIGDILLRSGETLRVNLVLGSMAKTNGSSRVLAYDVLFESPAQIDGSMVGFEYDVAVNVNSDDFEEARAGTYTAPLLFQVISNESQEVVWEQTVFIDAEKPSEQGGQQTVKDNDEDDQQNNDAGATRADEDDAQADDDDAQADEQSDNAETEDISLSDEGAAWAGGQWFAAWWWIFAIGATIALLLILLLIFGRRKKDGEE